MKFTENLTKNMKNFSFLSKSNKNPSEKHRKTCTKSCKYISFVHISNPTSLTIQQNFPLSSKRIIKPFVQICV